MTEPPASGYGRTVEIPYGSPRAPSTPVSICRASNGTRPGPGAAHQRTHRRCSVPPEQAHKRTPRTCTSEYINIRDVPSRATLDRIRHPECPNMQHGQRTETAIHVAQIRPGFDPEGLFSW